MKAATKRLVSLLASLGVLAVAIFVYTLLLSPAYARVNVLRGDLSSYREVFEDQKKVSDQVRNLLTEYQSLSSLRDTIARAIPGKEDYPGFVSQLSGLANAAQLRLDSIAMNSLPGGAGQSRAAANDLPVPGILQITLAATGSYQSLKDFLSSVEKNIRIMDLVSLDVSQAAGGGQNLSYNIILNGYYQSL